MQHTKETREFLSLVALEFTLLFFILNASSTTCSTATIKLNQGELSGQKSKIGEQELDVYLGIPFAKPPVGQLRFQKPVPAEKWSEKILRATKLGPPCPQRELGPDYAPWISNWEPSEDCLYLNIWAPGKSEKNY